MPTGQKKRFGVFSLSLVAKGTRRGKSYTLKSLPGVCRGPLHTILVYRFGLLIGSVRSHLGTVFRMGLAEL